MAVAFDAVGPGVNANAVGSFSYTHTPSGTPTAVGLGLCWYDESGTLTVTYGGAAMTSAESVTSSPLKGELFGLANPASGAQTVAGNWDLGSHYPIGSTITVTGSDTTTVFTDTNSASGNSGNTSVTVTSAVGELLMSAVMMNNGGVAIGPVSGENERFEAGNSGLQGQVQTAAGASPSVSMDTTSAASGPWVIVAGSFKSAAAAATPNHRVPGGGWGGRVISQRAM